ncbi:cytokinin riboside 5'-monophosphate phosphoribohydrolase LOG8-like [Citrus sinensis]|uniref:cytokinin riboside 5'-monophosphate phosphoribohydrolase LOG8-like n=1 Tax=Citrus sinensis TaxID=2711 RepID=UPI0022777DA4|nr:cytokinin riboside 5'-monophosphate phosphoribohydrolase LOG8-like [Citrus sinensis]
MAATSSSQLNNICVLSGFRCGKYKEFIQAFVDLGRTIAKRKLHLVYGGGVRGLSKLVSEAAFVRASQVLGIIPKALKPLGCLLDPPTGEELVVSGDLATLEALITFASWAHLNIHKKLIACKLEPDPMTLALDWATTDDGSNSRKKCKLDLTLCL